MGREGKNKSPDHDKNNNNKIQHNTAAQTCGIEAIISYQPRRPKKKKEEEKGQKKAHNNRRYAPLHHRPVMKQTVGIITHSIWQHREIHIFYSFVIVYFRQR